VPLDAGQIAQNLADLRENPPVVLTPDEIRRRRFARRDRGYDVAEVDAFLRDVAANYDAALNAIATLQAQRVALGRSLEDVSRALTRLRAATPAPLSPLHPLGRSGDLHPPQS
jgi:DivIVA domain-containing protein